MDINNGNYNSLKKASGKSGFTDCKIPVLEIPKREDIFMIYMFNEELQTIQVSFLDQNSKIIKQYKFDNYPMEKCNACKTELTVGNLSFLVDKETKKLLCDNCYQDKEKIADCSKLGEITYENNQLVNKLRHYLENNKAISTPQFIKIMEDLISYTIMIVLLLDIFKTNEACNLRCLFLQNYIDNLSSYLEIVNSVKMENLYLFLKNLVIVATCEINDNCLKRFFRFYFKNINCFNISEIQLKILTKIDEQNENNTDMFLSMAEFKFEKIKNTFVKDFIGLNKDFIKIGFDLIQKRTSCLQKIIIIKELKRNIIDFLRDYNYSFNHLYSKKVHELKFINEILYLLFKYNHKRFQEIDLDDYLINSIQKELQNINRLVSNSKDSSKTKLIQKLNNEIEYLERKKNTQGISPNKALSPKLYSNENSSKKENKFIKRDILLTEKEKDLLTNYLLTTNQDSYTSIYASKLNNSDEIDYNKIQVILEFLFFIRDKSIFLINLLKITFSLFSEFLSQFTSVKNMDKVVKNEIDDEDDEYIEELKKDFNIIFSEDHKENNEKLFGNLLVETNGNIEVNSVLNYIFYNKDINGYEKEINCLYQNVVLPKHIKDEKFIEDKNEKENNDYLFFQNEIDFVYKILDDKFNKDPLYALFIKYFENDKKELSKNNGGTQQIIKFYEKYVDNFWAFKRILEMKMETKKYIELINKKNLTLKKLEIIKEKYKYIEKELKDFLYPNQENYQKYYEQWKEKNEKLVIENYELKDLISDLKILIPTDEKIKIINKDKMNFTLILYILQHDHFLKDYI